MKHFSTFIILSALSSAQVFACPVDNQLSSEPNKQKLHKFITDVKVVGGMQSTINVRFNRPLTSNEIVSCFGNIITKVETLSGDSAKVWMDMANAYELSRYSLVKEVTAQPLNKEIK